MFKKSIQYCLLVVFLLWNVVAAAQERFPRPEFQSGYEYPVDQKPLQRSVAWEYIDTAVLIGALSIASWFAIKKRSRKGLVWLSVFSLAYFGFFREGCVCSVGSVQNVALALFNKDYSIPLTALLFFIIPLVFALFAGRVFCSSVCPLGAIQELTSIRPVKLPKVVESIMISIPFLYLALAVLFAANRSQFIICKYDPYVGIFRLDAPYTMVIFGSLLLIAGVFINRPYCRYLCPYGVLLNIFSRFSSRHLTITPAECTNCRLCEDSCPYDAIEPSDISRPYEEPKKARRRFLMSLALLPVFIAGGAIIFYNLAPSLSKIHRDVRLAVELRKESENGIPATSKTALAFREADRTEQELFENEKLIIASFKKGSVWAGIFLGLSFGLGMVSLSSRTQRTEYKPHQGKCYSCGRCFRYCPVNENVKV